MPAPDVANTSNENTESKPAIDINKLAEITAWRQNCGMEAMAHHIIIKLSTDALDADEQYQYKELVDAFKQYYLGSTENTEFTRADLKRLFKEGYTHPLDQGLVLGAVLRKLCGKAMLKRAQEEKDDYLKIFQEAVTKHLKEIWPEREEGVGLDGIAINISDANREYIYTKVFDFYKNYLKHDLFKDEDLAPFLKYTTRELKELKNQLLEKQIPDFDNKLDGFIENSKADMQKQWEDSGISQYSARLGDLVIGTEIAPEELDPLAQSLNIDLRMFSANNADVIYSIDGKKQADTENTLKLLIKNKHWQLELDTASKAAEHNVCYPKENSGTGRKEFDKTNEKYKTLKLEAIYDYAKNAPRDFNEVEQELKDQVRNQIKLIKSCGKEEVQIQDQPSSTEENTLRITGNTSGSHRETVNNTALVVRGVNSNNSPGENSPLIENNEHKFEVAIKNVIDKHRANRWQMEESIIPGAYDITIPKDQGYPATAQLSVGYGAINHKPEKVYFVSYKSISDSKEAVNLVKEMPEIFPPKEGIELEFKPNHSRAEVDANIRAFQKGKIEVKKVTFYMDGVLKTCSGAQEIKKLLDTMKPGNSERRQTHAGRNRRLSAN